MAVLTDTLRFNTQGNADSLNITRQVSDAVVKSGIQNGTVTLFTPSSTSGLTTIEYESGCLSDFRRLMDELASPEKDYAHEARWHDGNGHSHVRAALIGPSITIPFVEEKLTLGTWQQIMFVDFDVHPRQRELIVQIIGE
ncbi:MAG: YjbQ family protein [Anaerolineae bacterium]|jgi:secondary thiamine-phosphate synthase enzyme|nr:YjbQ family protein [Anaerolineae bacterium]MBT3713672.1 YjbQ family protein [Anaerolineae bacterium]MBT4310765.1 YjbQ family protein [Anaerolineae bacterium]MBT4458237.1 YjbQ family protein [Anaerolineae bacterium]MBT4841008.1 YjbQ family protein [Anaerolineae bacterium]